MMISSMGNIPDWLGIALALASLGGGAGAGTYYAAVHRARLEDRRELLKTWTRWLTLLFVVDPPGFDRTEGEPYESVSSRLAVRNLSALEEVNDLVRMLPWKDRALWSFVVDGVISIDRPLFERMQRGVAFGRVNPVEATAPTPDHDANSELVKDFKEFSGKVVSDYAHNAVQQGGDGGPILRNSWRFRNHLIRQVNPTFTSRFANLQVMWNLLRDGIRPWSTQIRPQRLFLVIQANNEVVK